MTITHESSGPTADGIGRDGQLVDPRAPRFGQTLTTIGLGGAALLDFPLLLHATAAVLVVAVVTGWRLDLYAMLWRRVAIPVVGHPTAREPAAPHRFARVLGAVGAGIASLLVLVDFMVPGYLVAGVVAGLAGLAAVTGLCIGCRLYRGVSLFRRLSVV